MNIFDYTIGAELKEHATFEIQILESDLPSFGWVRNKTLMESLQSVCIFTIDVLPSKLDDPTEFIEFEVKSIGNKHTDFWKSIPLSIRFITTLAQLNRIKKVTPK